MMDREPVLFLARGTGRIPNTNRSLWTWSSGFAFSRCGENGMVWVRREPLSINVLGFIYDGWDDDRRPRHAAGHGTLQGPV
ncbi:protein of unknown function [Nitrospina watsonii]|uniref:Uncharacterized protein n=1 Tax=Nitrospina watsonii TaxID=1323948 RepID=A0ABM9HAR1_9BACT|nr:protein of unknown function [Nitrospina watsonii]